MGSDLDLAEGSWEGSFGEQASQGEGQERQVFVGQGQRTDRLTVFNDIAEL